MAMTKMATLDKAQAETLLSNFFEKFSEVISSQSAPKTADFANILTPNFQLVSNGKTQVKNLADYMPRLVNFQKRYSNVELSEPLDDLVIAENKVVVLYNANFTTRDGKRLLINMMAIATIEGNKISRWMQIAAQQGSSQWDS